MELFQEILCHALANEKAQVSFPGLSNTDAAKIVELECYKALRKIKAILEDDSLKTANAFIGLKKLSACLRIWVPAAATGMTLAELSDKENGAIRWEPYRPILNLCFHPTLSKGITLHFPSSVGSGGSGSGLAVAVSMKPPIFSAAPLCISLVMWV